MLYIANTQTDLLSQFKDMSDYHLWAITRLVDWLKTKPAAQLEEPAASSFTGIKATLLHIWDVECHWFAHLQGRPAPEPIGLEFDGSMLEALEGIVEQAACFNDYVQALAANELQEDCTCQVMFVGEICRPRYEIIFHCLNHSTYHRGQVVSIGHQVGLKDAPMTDYMYYVLRVREAGFPDRRVKQRWQREKAAHFVHEQLLAVNFFNR